MFQQRRISPRTQSLVAPHKTPLLAFPLRHLPSLCSLMPGSYMLCSASADSREKVSFERASFTAKKISLNPQESTKSPLHHFSVSIAQIFGRNRVATEHEITVEEEEVVVVVVVSLGEISLGMGVGKTTSMLILKVSSFSQDSCMRRLHGLKNTPAALSPTGHKSHVFGSLYR